MAVVASFTNSDDTPEEDRIDGQQVLDYLASHLPKVQALSCSQVLTDDDISHLQSFLARNFTQTSQLRSISLSKNGLTAAAAPALGRLILTAPELEDLDLSHNVLKPEGLQVLLEAALTSPTCKTLSLLNLTNNKLGGKNGASLIARLLRDNKSLASLLIAKNGVGPRCMSEIANSLEDSILEHLDLSQNKLADRGAGFVAYALTSNGTKLKSLDLAMNKIRCPGAKQLAGALVQGENKTLLKLNLRENNIGSIGAQHFGRVLLFSYTLLELNLSRNNVDDQAVEVIAMGIKGNKDSALQRLDLSWNLIKDEGACALAEMLRDSSVLTYLNLGSNCIGDVGIAALAKSLPFPLALKELDLVGNQMRDPSPLIDVLCHHETNHETRVEQIHCDLNPLSPDAEARLRAAFAFRSNKRGWLGKLLTEIRENRQVSFNLTRRRHSDEEIMCISRQLFKYPNRRITTASFGGALVTHRSILSLTNHVIVPKPCNLERLFIRNSPLRDAGANALAQGLASNRTLRQICLQKCYITAQGARMLSRALRMNTTLVRISLEKNQIGDAGFREICNAILEPPHPSIMSLNVSRNEITDQGLSDLISITRLQELYLDGNNITDYGALSLTKGIYGNKSLKWLSLCGTQITPKGIKTLKLFLENPLALDYD